MRNRGPMLWGVVALAVSIVAWRLLRPAAITVDTEPAAAGPLVVSVAEEGRTEVRDRFVIAAPVTGRVGRLTLECGDAVARDAVVACVAPQPLDPRAHDQARARLEEARDGVEAAAATVAQVRAALEQAGRERVRTERLAAQRAIAVQEAERAQLAEETRRRELEAAESRLNAARHQVEEARSALLVASPGGTRHCFDIHAPVAGRVLRVVQESERVVLAGSPILEIGDPSRLDVVAELLSADAVKVHPGDTMLVENWGGDGDLVARVRRVEPAGFTKVSALGVEEQRVRVVGEFLTPPSGLGDGFRVDVRIVLWRGDTVLQVPSTALFRRNGGWRVFVVEDGRIASREVQVGREGGGRTEVVGGLGAGALVVRHPSDRIEEGVRALPARTE
ncbi:MAG TPA: HlyD family efflux transporter periplasmic adaptor subunit [Gemmatimonadales bacterium]|nr:HlyD family efflux transporter periplasmic adaptor subunit [Gemmatimonadales bacterium]